MFSTRRRQGGRPDETTSRRPEAARPAGESLCCLCLLSPCFAKPGRTVKPSSQLRHRLAAASPRLHRPLAAPLPFCLRAAYILPSLAWPADGHESLCSLCLTGSPPQSPPQSRDSPPRTGSAPSTRPLHMLAFAGADEKAEGTWRVDYLVIEQPPSPPALSQRSSFPQTMPALSSPDAPNSHQQHQHQQHNQHNQHTPGTKPASSLFAHPASKQPHEKAAANTFLWNPDFNNGDTGDGVTASANFFVDSRSRGPNSKAGATVSISPSRDQDRDRTESVDSSLRNGCAVSSRNSMADNATTTTPTTTTNGASAHNEAYEEFADEHERWMNGTGQAQGQQGTINGAALPYRPSSKPSTTTNYQASQLHNYTGYPSTAELTPPSSSSQHEDAGPAPTRPPPPIPTTATTTTSTTTTTTTSVSKPTTPTPKPTTTLDTNNLAPEQQTITYRHSSPAPQGPSSAHSEIPTSPSSPPGGRLIHRHTLQVPRHSSSRASREPSTPIAIDDTLLPIDRVSSPTSVLRRGSFTIPRLSQRSNHSEPQLDEALHDEGAARWTEAFKQRRASKRKRREEEDEDRVIVGTKVDQHHVNWVTAYNMLTGIRFTVSRTNAKLDRDLTDADFDAKHKFSFDMYVYTYTSIFFRVYKTNS